MNALPFHTVVLKVQNALQYMRNNTIQIASFIAVWYFIEILNIINIAIFFYPPMLIAVIGIIAGILLSIHIIQLYWGKAVNYCIQLFLMDIHVAYAAGITVATILSDSNWFTAMVIIVRDVVAMLEILLVFYMTNDEE